MKRTLIILAALLALAITAAAQEPPTPSVLPASDLDLWTVVKSLMASVNVGVLVMLTVVATGFHRVALTLGASARASNALLLAAPILGGAALGALSAVGKAQMTTGGWIETARLIQSVLEGSIINGGMAVVLGYVASVGLAKAGFLPEPPKATA